MSVDKKNGYYATDDKKDTTYLVNKSLPSTVAFTIKEAYKTIRTNILLSLVKEGCKILVITSALPNEGKTTSAINIAISLAQVGKKTLLVDCDLRKSKVNKYLGITTTNGLSDVVIGDIDFDDAVNQTKIENLQILSSGKRIKNPSEILASELTEKLIKRISEKYEYIILDSPPINVVSDALPLIKFSDAVIFVARELVTTRSETKKAFNSLKLIEAKVLGLVYIGTDSNQPYYHKSYYSKYSRYGKYGKYGSRYGYGNKYSYYYYEEEENGNKVKKKKTKEKTSDKKDS